MMTHHIYLSLFLLAHCCSTCEGACNGQYTDIAVSSKNGSDSTNCGGTTDHKCATLQYVLTSLALQDCTRISLYDNQTISSTVSIKGVSGLVIEGVAVMTTVTCIGGKEHTTDIEMINCTDVQLMTIEWINCQINSTIFQPPTCPTVHYFSVAQPSHMTLTSFTRQELELPPTSANTSCEVDSCNMTQAMLGEGIIAEEFDNIPGVNVHLGCLINGKIKDSCNEVYHLTGHRSPFIIKGKDTSNGAGMLPVLIWHTLVSQNTVGCLYVNITNCLLGYVYDVTSQVCTCYNKADDVIVCVNNTACIKTGYWYGIVSASDQHRSTNHSKNNFNASYSASPCPFGYCNYTIKGMCPTQQCGKDGSVYQFYCRLPEDSDSLCLFDRGGELCSSCPSDNYFSFDALGRTNVTVHLLHYTLPLLFCFGLSLLLLYC